MSENKPQFIEKPWGSETIWASVEDKYLGKFLNINPDCTLSRQYHVEKDETVMCVDGEAYLEYKLDFMEDYHCLSMRLNVPYHIPSGMEHRMYTEDNHAKILEVSTYHPDDVVRLEDEYGRC